MTRSILRLPSLLLLLSLNGLILSSAQAEEAPRPSLDISGVEGVAAENIRAFTDLSGYSCKLPEWRLDRLAKASGKNTRQALRALGYYQPDVKIDARRDNGCWSLHLQIEPGPRVLVRELDITVGGELEKIGAYQKLRDKFLLKIGQPLNHADYEKTKLDIETLANHFGFFEGRFTHRELSVDPTENAADIHLHFASGPRYRIGKIEIKQHQFKDKLIRKYLQLREGQPYNSENLTQQQQALSNSGYFSAVEITARREPNDEHIVPVNIQLAERNKHAYRIGLGASTNEGPRASLIFENRWANQYGHSYVYDTRWSPVTAETAFNYSIPLGDSGIDRLELGFGYRRESTDTTDAITLKSSARYIKVLADGWKRTISLEALQEDFQAGNDDDNVTLLMPGIGWSKSTRDQLRLPHKGWRLNLNFKAASEDVFSAMDLGQLTGSAKMIRPLGKGRILVNASAGLTEVNHFSRLPVSLRFYAGGDNSVRGFAYKSLGPENEEGEVTGGRHMLTGSIEYEHPLKQNWGLAAFVDTGNAFNDFNEYELRTGVGIGLRFHSPIGPVRIDVARDIEGKKDVRLHLSMGPDL